MTGIGDFRWKSSILAGERGAIEEGNFPEGNFPLDCSFA
jgi:hypothetical protein